MKNSENQSFIEWMKDPRRGIFALLYNIVMLVLLYQTITSEWTSVDWYWLPILTLFFSGCIFTYWKLTFNAYKKS